MLKEIRNEGAFLEAEISIDTKAILDYCENNDLIEMSEKEYREDCLDSFGEKESSQDSQKNLGE